MNASTSKPRSQAPQQARSPSSVPTPTPAPATPRASPRGKVSVYVGDRVALVIWTVCALVLAGLLLKDLDRKSVV